MIRSFTTKTAKGMRSLEGDEEKRAAFWTWIPGKDPRGIPAVI